MCDVPNQVQIREMRQAIEAVDTDSPLYPYREMLMRAADALTVVPVWWEYRRPGDSWSGQCAPSREAAELWADGGEVRPLFAPMTTENDV